MNVCGKFTQKQRFYLYLTDLSANQCSPPCGTNEYCQSDLTCTCREGYSAGTECVSTGKMHKHTHAHTYRRKVVYGDSTFWLSLWGPLVTMITEASNFEFVMTFPSKIKLGIIYVFIYFCYSVTIQDIPHYLWGLTTDLTHTELVYGDLTGSLLFQS